MSWRQVLPTPRYRHSSRWYTCNGDARYRCDVVATFSRLARYVLRPPPVRSAPLAAALSYSTVVGTCALRDGGCPVTEASLPTPKAGTYKSLPFAGRTRYRVQVVANARRRCDIGRGRWKLARPSQAAHAIACRWANVPYICRKIDVAKVAHFRTPWSPVRYLPSDFDRLLWRPERNSAEPSS